MKRYRFDGRCELFGKSEWAGNAMAKASLCNNDESCDDDDDGENKDTDAASSYARREHCGAFEQMPEASVNTIVKPSCRCKFA